MRKAVMSETGAQLFARLEGRRCIKNIEPRLFPDDCGPSQGDVVELHGTEGTAKTEILYHVIVRCILPKRCGGLETEVMFVDTDYHFDTLRLVTILESRLANGKKGAPVELDSPEKTEEKVEEEKEEETMKACLGRLFVVHCSSSGHLLLSLHHVESWLCSRPALGLLMIDSISAFYWQDRCSGGESVLRQEANLRKCSQLLDRLRRDYGIVVFATVHAVMRNYGSSEVASATAAPSPSTSSASTPASNSRRWSSVVDFDKPYLCRAWQRLVTQRLVLSKCEVGKDRRVVFSVACTTTRSRGVKRSSFGVTDEGVHFLS